MAISRDKNAGGSHSIKNDNSFFERIFGNKLNESKSYSGRNYEQIEVRECWLIFGAERFVFLSAVQKYND